VKIRDIRGFFFYFLQKTLTGSFKIFYTNIHYLLNHNSSEGIAVQGKTVRITFKGDYAIKSLLFLAVKYHEEGEHYFQISEISRLQDIPEKFLEQIFLLLRKAGFLKSQRGMRGGFALNRDPVEISLGEVVRLIEGTISPIACVSQSAYQACDFEPQCVLKPVWNRVRNAVSGIVDSVNFAELAADTLVRQKQKAESLMYYI